MCILKGSLLAVCFAFLTMAKAEDSVQAFQAVTNGMNQFSSAFFQTVVKENPGNLITSPLSAGIVLAMTAYGAREETENQFRKVLRLPSFNSLAITGYKTLIDNLNQVKENKLLLANKIFIAKQFGLKSTYQDLTTTYFHSTTQLVNFDKSDEAAATINTWVQQNTNDLIKNIVTPGDLNADTALVLANAVYFKGQWKNKFNPNLTKDMPFNVNKDIVKSLPTMYRQGNYKYGELPELNAKFIVIPYKGDELNMIIILPNEVEGLAEVETKLEGTSLTNILNQGYEREVQLYLPKFKIESKIELNEVLEKMGLVDAFTSNANFSGIADERIAISKVIQKAFIEVNEEGSEAAAATGVVMASRVHVQHKTEVMMIDRPFIYNIIKIVADPGSENCKVIPIFVGQISEPSVA